MTLRRRGDETPPSPAAQASESKSGGKKPVLVYIFVLFLAAFLLMALSLLIHQRSNTEALGALSESVNAMQGVQGTQEKIIALQDQLSDTQEELIQAQREADVLSQEAAASKSAMEKAQHRLEAMTALYELQQHWSNEEYDGCRRVIEDMENRDLPALLETAARDGVTSPAERYLQLKEAVEALQEAP